MTKTVEKIDITKTFIEVENHLNFIELYSLGKNGEFIDVSAIKTQGIEVTKYYIYEYIVNDKKRYIAIKDKDMYDKILNISKDDINFMRIKFFEKGKKEGFKNGLKSGRDHCRLQIKNLSWWKRLFNKF